MALLMLLIACTLVYGTTHLFTQGAIIPFRARQRVTRSWRRQSFET